MTTVGDYELEHQIGAGASGTVWRAVHQGPVRRVVALKRLRSGSGALDMVRMRREATVLTELDHPHVVRVLEVVHDGDGVALAMQYAPGGSLADLLAERGRLTPGAVVAVAAPIAEALASAHRRGVMHGDVKPANVLFTSDGEPLLTDFGVARTLGAVTSDQVAGTAEYLAPELLDGAHPDARADVYSLGVVCYQALAGRVPYTGPAPLAVARAADAARHPRLDEVADVPPGLAEVVETAMARHRERRPATADAFARALRAAVPPDDVVLPGPAGGPHPAAGGPGHDGEPGSGEGDDAGTGHTRTFGPRPPRREPEQPGGRDRRRLPLVALVGLVAAGLVYVVRGPLASDRGAECADHEELAAEITAIAGGGGGDVRDAAADTDVQVVAGDVGGDGCSVQGAYRVAPLPDGSTGMVLSIPLDGAVKQIALGEPGDQVALGDWDCDGVDTPGLYRAAGGVVQYFDVWPAVEQRSYQPDTTDDVVVGGEARLVDGSGTDGDCDRIEVVG
jgi:eukaryotic-like serine/threonine-protein kinase